MALMGLWMPKMENQFGFCEFVCFLGNQKEKTIGCNFLMAFVNPFVGVGVQIE